MVIRILEIPVRAHSPLGGIHSSDYVQAYLGFCHRNSLLECVCWGMFTPAALPSPAQGSWAFVEVLSVLWYEACCAFFVNIPGSGGEEEHCECVNPHLYFCPCAHQPENRNIAIQQPHAVLELRGMV